jgi:pyruvate/2-oxoglutarate dehydrogenase complex dihydrolipoamide dehydrogenase (E3) component
MTDDQDDHPQFDVAELAEALRTGLAVADRTHRFKSYPRCFVGSEACAWMVEHGIASDLSQAEIVGNVLLEHGVFHHVTRDHGFKNEYLFYRFTSDEDHGRVAPGADGNATSWAELRRLGWNDPDLPQPEGASLQPRIPRYEAELAHARAASSAGVEPLDEHNVALLDAVHPRAWVDPEPKGTYNMVVIGGGTAGLVTAAAVAGLGGKVALIEQHLLGGDCLNVGCVPSKALLSAAHAAARLRRAGALGVRVTGVDDLAKAVSVDFGAVMERLRRVRAAIAPHDSAARFAGLGVDVFLGRGAFTGPDSVTVNGKTLHFARAAIATGGSPALPPIPGLSDVPVLTNHNLFNLTALPPRLAIIGAGVIGVEMAQAFARFGSRVTILERGQRILPREDDDAALLVQRALEADGVTLAFGASAASVRHTQTDGPFPRITIALAGGGELEVDALLVATGRKPNVEGLGLDSAGIAYDPRRGVEVSDALQTSNPNVYAVGDVATRYQFTHAADFMARMTVKNALFFGSESFSKLIIPWAVYTDPEVAHVGLYPRDMDERGIAYRTFERHFAQVDRAIAEGETEGFVRVHVAKGSDQILGATIVGQRAGDLISEITLAMKTGTGLGAVASVIHPYPTRAEAIRQTADAYNRTRLTTTVKKLFRGLLAVRR